MKNKFLISKSKGFTKLPTKIFNIGLDVYSGFLYCTLFSCSETFNPSKQWTSEKLKISRPRLNKAFKVLLDKNIIKCLRQGKHHLKAIYSFVEVKDWIV